MRVYTYHENINFSDQDELVALWKKSWERQGFEAIVLNRSHAEVHPYYKEFVKRLEELHLQVMNKPLSKYGLSCYLRWLAYATQPEEKFYVSDYDVINNKFSQQEPTDELHLIDLACPCIASGTPKQFEKLCHTFVEHSKENLEQLKQHINEDKTIRHYHDQEFFIFNFVPRYASDWENALKKYNIKMTRDRKMLTGAITNVEDMNAIKTFQLIHFSHFFCKNIIGTCNHFSRTETTKSICKEYLNL